MEDWSLPDNNDGSMNGIDQVLFWKLQGVDPPSQPTSQPSSAAPPTTMPSMDDSFQDEVDKLFQQSLAMQQQEQQQPSQIFMPSSFSQRPSFNAYSSQEIKEEQSSPTMENTAASPARKRTRSSATFDQDTSKRHAFMDQTIDSYMVDPAAIYRVPFGQASSTAPSYGATAASPNASSPASSFPYTNPRPPYQETYPPRPTTAPSARPQQQQSPSRSAAPRPPPSPSRTSSLSAPAPFSAPMQRSAIQLGPVHSPPLQQRPQPPSPQPPRTQQPPVHPPASSPTFSPKPPASAINPHPYRIHLQSSPASTSQQQQQQPAKPTPFSLLSSPPSTPQQLPPATKPPASQPSAPLPSLGHQQQQPSLAASAPVSAPAPPAPLHMTLPRPQLRLHLAKRKPESPKPCERDDKDPMKPELDLVNLQKLTIMVLRSLGVTMALEELPAVDIDESFPTDAEQVLPPTAMQLITKMILGTSGDKDVAQTVGSQICNGDLVALQRMIVAALKTKNIVIHTIQSSSCNGNGTTPAPTATQANIARASGPVKQGNKTIYDLSTATYHTPNHVTRLFLRLYRFILNTLLSTPHCWPFIQPVPTSAVFYHQEVRYPMDLSTIEHNIWSGLYTRFAKFEQDMQLIWKNAKAFHGSVGTIPKHAENLELLFYKVVLDIKKQVGKSGTTDFRFDVSDSLPEEGDFAYPPMSQVFSKQTIVYGIAAMSPFEDKAKKPKGLTNDKQLYLQLNGPFFQALEEMKQDPFGNHPPVPRFYIAKNRTLLRQVRAHGVLAIFYNTRTTRVRSKHYKIITDVVLTYPASTLHDIDQTDDFAARGWMHLRPLRLIEQLEFHVNEVIERDYFRRMYATSKLMITDDPPHHHHQHHHQPHGFPQPYQQPAPPAPPATSAKLLQSNASKLETKRMLKKMVQQILDLPIDDNDDDLDDLLLAASSTPQPPTQATSSQLIRNKKKSRSPSQKHPKPGHPKTASPVFKKEPHRSSTSSPLSTPEDRQPSSTLSPDSFASTPQSPLQPLKSSPMAISPSNKPESEMLHEVWQRLLERCETKGAHIVNVQQKYEGLHWAAPDSEGFFKQVYFLQDVVVQTFRQMTMHQRITEVACLMKLRNLPHMAQLCEILHNDNGDIVGLSMERYQTTLKQYTHAHSHHRLSAYQKYHVIHQMLVCMKTIHAAGLAHRDLSEVNIMVNNVEGELEDGSSNICLYLIDFGKAVFCEKADVQQWFVDVPRGLGEYDGDIVPETKEELDEWCDKLPWIKAKPDHGYRMYRSIQTLPKSRTDTQVLKHLIHPKAEDMYSIGVMIWKIFTETEPWRGILDTDLQGLRYIAEDDYRIQRALEHEVQGELSRKLLLMLLKRNPQDRATADQLLNWIEQEDVHTGLLSEWKMYSSETRATRKSKTMYGFDESDTFTSTAKRPSKKSKAKVRKNGTAASSTTASSATSDMMQTD